MNWTQTLEGEVEDAYRATEGLLRLVEKGDLAWKPATGANWMTTAQLLRHVADACGAGMKGFVTGDWGMPADASPDGPLPTAEQMASVKSVAEARALLAADKRTALDSIRGAGEADLSAKKVGAPWDPTPLPLGRQLLHCVLHLNQHKGQLFYYLKLQGKSVHTGSLYGM